MGIKIGLEALYSHEREEERRYIATMSDAEKKATSTPEKYSSKDFFAHIAYWNGKMAATLERAFRDEIPEPYGDLEEVNTETYEMYKDHKWSQILDLLQEATDSLQAAIVQLPEENLIEPGRYTWQRGQRLWRSIVYVTYYHTMRHLAELYFGRGDSAYGQQLQQQAANLQERLDDSPGWRASVHYNLACYYAITGARSKAIDSLDKAFTFSPDLIAWSLSDSEIDPIRDDPGYLNLIPDSPRQE